MEADLGMTSAAMDNVGRNALDNTLLVKFFMKARLDSAASKAQGRNIFKDEVYIEIMTPGNKDSIIQRPASELDINRFPEHYAKFKARAADADMIEGTPLEEWPAVTRSQVEDLKYHNVRTVEQLVSMADVHAQGLMGLGILKKKAEAFLEAAETQAAGEEIRQLREQNQALLKQANDTTAVLASLKEELAEMRAEQRSAAVVPQTTEMEDQKPEQETGSGEEASGEERSRRRQRRDSA